MGKEKIRVGISIGDVNGVGPEIILKCFADQRIFDTCLPVVYGSYSVLLYYAELLEMNADKLHKLGNNFKLLPGKINICEVSNDEVRVEVGRQSLAAGKFAFLALEKATQDIASNKVDILVTAPIDKFTIQESGFKFPGHTEYLANYANEDNYLMMMVGDGLKVAVVSGHSPLVKVASEITETSILEKAGTLLKSLSYDFGISKPKIAVLGLNPHAGDNGKIGEKEISVISPAIEKLKNKGVLAFGPFGADGFFGTGSYKNYDAVLAMYHDQGLIPFKTLCFDSGVNFTAGLPIVRTSPDHGVAYDIAGKGKALVGSFRSAVYLALDIYKNRAFEKHIKQNAIDSRTDIITS